MVIPTSLVEALRKGKIVPFVGAGVSMAVRRRDGTHLFPSWAQLLEIGAERLREEGKAKEAALVHAFIASKRYLEAAKDLSEGLQGESWRELLQEQICPRRADADDATLSLARAVWGLGSQLILTTNYDRVLRWACPAKDDIDEWDIENTAELAQLAREGRVQRPTVWHLHGKIDNIANLVLTPDGYKRLYPVGKDKHHYEAAWTSLRLQIAAKAFLFIGFSLEDDHLGAELTSLSDSFKGFTGKHYALIREGSQELLRTKNLPVEALTFSDFGEPLLNLVTELGRQARADPPSATSGTPHSSSISPLFRKIGELKSKKITADSEGLDSLLRGLRGEVKDE